MSNAEIAKDIIIALIGKTVKNIMQKKITLSKLPKAMKLYLTK